ncbi:alpha/beta hydrolase [bacterium]|nr:alpha/beta hydrolase [bacterium]MBT6831672.1 alpha/beta hydrolase [bacterium]MBT6996318.1 alpha/beta hydrolase [bacterium]MBT7772996.1 alpha/beta hydrolase [bacterium]
MKSEFLKVAGMKTHFFRAGSGEKIVILHGWDPTINLEKSYGALVAELEKNFEVFVVGMPGFGGSDFPEKTGWTTEKYAEWLENFLEKMGEKNAPVALYGHSFGCRVIVRFLRRNPKFAGKIILTGAAGIKWNPERGRQKLLFAVNQKFPGFKKMFRKFCPQKLRPLIVGKLLGAHDWAIVPDALEQTLKKTLAEPDFRNELPKISQKILLIWGENDTITPTKSAHVFAKKLPHAELVILPEARHGLHRTHFEKIVPLVRKFLGK